MEREVTAAIPVTLHGAMQFDGTAKGRIADLDVKGHIQATNAEFAAGDDGRADRFSRGGRGVFAELRRVGGEFDDQTRECGAESGGEDRAAEGGDARRVVTYVWDEGMALDAKAQLANAEVVDVLQIAGQQENVPLTGTVAMNANAVGTLQSLSGSGHLSLMNGVAYGEPYESAVAELTVQGKDIEASHVVLKLHGMQITGNGGYDVGSEHLHAHVEGHDLLLSKFVTVQKAKTDVDGVVSVVADANGTMTQPGLKANVKLAV